MYALDSSNAYIASYCYDFHVGGGGTVGDVNVECTFPTTSPGNNGNLYQAKNNLDGNRTQNFSYDTLNRIQQAYTSGPNWGETYTIDAWGNLTNRSAVSGKTNYEPLSAAPATTANRLTGYSYDVAGNLTNDGAGHAFTYDAENRLATAGGVTYTYDGDGKRVMKSNGTIYWTGAGSDVLAESNLSGTISEEYVYLNGRRFLRMDRPSGSVHLYFNDLVGSARLITDVNGNVQKQSDLYPYGGEIVISGSDSNHYKFTGKERDSESGLDMFGARYYASSFGRFMTPDWSANEEPVPYADLDNPQTLNLYAYVKNSPLILHDATGHVHCDPDTAKWGPNGVTVTAGACYPDAHDIGMLALAVGHHFIPKQVWADIDRASNAWKFLNRVTSGALKNPRASNSFDRLHRALNKDMEELVSDLEKQLGKSIEDFNKGRLSRACGTD